MAKIQLTPQELAAQSTEMTSLQKEYEALLKQTNTTLTDVNGNWSEMLSRNFIGKIGSAQRGCDKLVASLETGAQLAKLSAQSYESMDSQLAKYFAGGEADLSVSQYTEKMQQAIDKAAEEKKEEKKKESSKKKKKKKKKSAWDKFCDAVDNAVDTVSTGVAKVADLVEDGVESAIAGVGDLVDKGIDLAQDIGEGIVKVGKGAAEAIGDAVGAVVDSYKEKGLAYKIVQTGIAAVATVGAVSSIVASWGAAAGSGGLATGLACVSTAYGVNTIANSFADIYNCWAGDVEKVGEVNVLKDGMEWAGGEIGEALGNEELGENIGGALYTAGSLVALINNVSILNDKVIQLDDYGQTLKDGASQLSQGIDGVIDIITHSPIGNIPMDLKLLSHQVPELMDAIGVLQVGGEIISTGWNIGTTSGNVINEVLGRDGGPSLWECLGWDEVGTAMNTVETGAEVIDTIKPESWETLIDDLKAGGIIISNIAESLSS